MLRNWARVSWRAGAEAGTSSVCPPAEATWGSSVAARAGALAAPRGRPRPLPHPRTLAALAGGRGACSSDPLVVSTQTAPSTSQVGGGAHTPVAHTPDQVVQGLQIPGALPAQPSVAAQTPVVPVMADDEQRRLERFGRIQPPSFSGVESEDAQGFLDKCQRILQTMGILETSGVSFTTFPFSRAAFRWWETYERRKPVGAVPLTWHEFSILFLEKFVSQSRKEELRRQFEQLRQDGMSMNQY
ncbi:uncharacterized protein [Nicotiana tomentosiformis]|uniref:uncharacterized protein n=1 Tax=Nicotiana tomentosiformis TaxID=4098 RepID=UPI00388C646E